MIRGLTRHPPNPLLSLAALVCLGLCGCPAQTGSSEAQAERAARTWITSGGVDAAWIPGPTDGDLVNYSLTSAPSGQPIRRLTLLSASARGPGTVSTLPAKTFVLETQQATFADVATYDLTFRVEYEPGTGTLASEDLTVSLRPTESGWAVIPTLPTLDSSSPSPAPAPR